MVHNITEARTTVNLAFVNTYILPNYSLYCQNCSNQNVSTHSNRLQFICIMFSRENKIFYCLLLTPLVGLASVHNCLKYCLSIVMKQIFVKKKNKKKKSPNRSKVSLLSESTRKMCRVYFLSCRHELSGLHTIL